MFLFLFEVLQLDGDIDTIVEMEAMLDDAASSLHNDGVHTMDRLDTVMEL